MAIADLTAEFIREKFNYDPLTGSITWAVRAPGIPFGREAGCFDREGYRQIRLSGLSIKAHRIIWMHVFGAWPSGVIDHINGKKSDNRIANLRDVDNTTNRQNIKRAYKKASVMPLGVYYETDRNKFRASIGTVGGIVRLGRFDTKEAANAAYLEAKRKMHGGCTI